MRAPTVTSRRLVMERSEKDRYLGIQVSDIIQMCCLNMLTGVCSVNENGFQGQVFIKNGDVIHASADGIQGEQAFYRVIRHSHGDIEFKEGPLTVGQTIKSPWEHLLMEGTRLHDQNTLDATEGAMVMIEPPEPTLIHIQVKRLPMPKNLQQGAKRVRTRKTNTPGLIKKDDVVEECIIDTISDEGVSMRTLGSFTTGDVLRITFKLPPHQEELTVSAEVAGISADTISLETRFVRLSDHAQRLIGFFLWNA